VSVSHVSRSNSKKEVKTYEDCLNNHRGSSTLAERLYCIKRGGKTPPQQCDVLKFVTSIGSGISRLIDIAGWFRHPRTFKTVSHVFFLSRVMKPKPKSDAFTLSLPGITNRLITPIIVLPAFDPNTTTDVQPNRQVNGLWDTGATNTSITAKLAAALNLQVVGVCEVTHAGGKTDRANRYLVNLFLPNNVGVVGVMVTECLLPNDFDVLIGMDIISTGDFAVTHFNGSTVFSFRTPSIEAIDFVKRQTALTYQGTSANAPCPCGSGRKYKQCHRNN
jgi:hypothetical protein